MAKRALILLVGWTFILLGIIGLFLPILQGILFLLIGLLILSKESRLAKLILKKFHTRYPDQYKKIYVFNQRMKNRFRQFVKR